MCWFVFISVTFCRWSKLLKCIRIPWTSPTPEHPPVGMCMFPSVTPCWAWCKNNKFSNPVDVRLLTWSYKLCNPKVEVHVSVMKSVNTPSLHSNNYLHSVTLCSASSLIFLSSTPEITVNNFCSQSRTTLFFRESRSPSFLHVTFIPGLDCSLFPDKYLPFMSATKPVF